MTDNVQIAHQPPAVVFPWPKGWQLTALDETILAVPAAVVGDGETIGSVIHCEDNVLLNFPTVPHSTPDGRILIWLQPGQSVWIAKSCQAMVVPSDPSDTAVRRFKICRVAE
jgi:hypothetical protein